MPNARLNYLFSQYFKKTATEQEEQELFGLLDTYADDEELTALLKNTWDGFENNEAVFDPIKSGYILNYILQAKAKEDETVTVPLIKRNLLWKKITAAAAILLLSIIGAFFYLNQPEKPFKKVVQKRPLHNDILPGGNKAVLTLANGKTIILDNAHTGILAKQGSTDIAKTKDGQVIYKAPTDTRNDQNIALNTISTPTGGQYQVVLSDGSKVWLNAASSLRFPAVFKGKTRAVEIRGEAYFEVAKNAAMPFLVKTGRSVVEVLGTHFNVMAYDNESFVKTTLLEGSVKVRSGNSVDFLKPGQQALLNAQGQTKIIEDVDVDDETAWKNGLFQFKDAGIETVMRQAERWYDVTISYEGKIPVKQFTGRISRNVKISELLNMLKFFGVNFKIDGRNITVMK